MLPSGISTHGYRAPRFNIDQKGDIVSYLPVKTAPSYK